MSESSILTADELTDIRQRFEATTQGTWGWYGNARSGHHPELYLATREHGRRYVMGFQRWGFAGSQPEFRRGNVMIPAAGLLKFEVNRDVTGVKEAKADPATYRFDINGIDAPDAVFIAQAHQDVPRLLAMVVALQQQLTAMAPTARAAE